MAKYTVVGGQGFIGSEIIKQLEERAHKVFIPERNDSRLYTDDLGIVIYCAGYGDCKNNPLKVFNSNSALLASMLEHSVFDKLVYVSSTRLYMGQECASERDDLIVLTNDDRRLFNLTKLVSEELCLLSNKNTIILRPSNVYGLALKSPLFLPTIIRNAINNNQIDMYVTPDYKKDYISVIDVAYATCELAEKSELSQRIFNIASGVNTSACDIANLLRKETGCNINWHEVSVDDIFPVNDISMIKNEIIFNPKNVLDDLKLMIDEFKLNM
ncbi:SDR family oxidoreductase [Photobacterium toruni]|uniref:SDR family oxidoreductase n=1 Tax=Photobacterium toruni TaxID=1935446 RepID=A0ABU6L6M0_9GAMM|nr:SDR family oxidoreductase [Photobacterium toruni]